MVITAVKETNEAIHATYKSSDYVIDPHTAVAAGVYKKYLADTDDHTPTVIASTASPYKFTRSVMDAVAENTEDMDQLSPVNPWAVVHVFSA